MKVKCPIKGTHNKELIKTHQGLDLAKQVLSLAKGDEYYDTDENEEIAATVKSDLKRKDFESSHIPLKHIFRILKGAEVTYKHNNRFCLSLGKYYHGHIWSPL